MTDNNLEELRNDIKEAKIAIEHKHTMVWRAAKQKFIDTPEVKEQTGRYAKIWLLNAKSINGNGWGVAPETIDKNIRYFKNRPYVITAKNWFPDTVYGGFEHPFVPTTDLHKVLNHQEHYRVGTIKEVQKNGDDYYAIIEINQKFAHMSLPPFCSPAIFQTDFREPENRISKWIPLHLAGLDSQPAYGARIALMKGTCLGTAIECSIQLRTAKMYDQMEISCPIQAHNIEQRLAAIGIDLEKKEKTLDDVKSEHALKQRKYLNTPQKKPTHEEFTNIISAQIKTAEEYEHKPNEFWEFMNPSQRQHLIDPNDIDNTRELVMKEWNDLNEEEMDKVQKNMKSRYEKSDNPTMEDIQKWWIGLIPSQRQHYIDPDNWYLPESMSVSEKPWLDLSETERNEIITSFSFRHGGIDVGKFVTGKGIFYKRGRKEGEKKEETDEEKKETQKKAKIVNSRLFRLKKVGKIYDKLEKIKIAEEDDDDNTTYQKSKHLKIISQKNAEPSLEERLKKSSLRSETNSDVNIVNVSDQVQGTHDRMYALGAELDTSPDFDRTMHNFNKISDKLDYKDGFSHIPHENKTYNGFLSEHAKHLQKSFGDGRNPLHIISHTQVEGTKLTEEHRKHYNNIISEGHKPIIGGFTMNNGKKVTDVGAGYSVTDNQATKLLQKHKQEASFRISPEGKPSIFNK